MAALASKPRVDQPSQSTAMRALSLGPVSSNSDKVASQAYAKIALTVSVKSVRERAMTKSIAALIAQHGGYLSDRYIMAVEGISQECFEGLISKSANVRKSIIVLADGANVYRLRGLDKALHDYWRAFTYYASEEFWSWFR